MVFVNKGGVTRIKEFYDEKVIFKSKSTDDFGMPPVLASVLYYWSPAPRAIVSQEDVVGEGIGIERWAISIVGKNNFVIIASLSM